MPYLASYAVWRKWHRCSRKIGRPVPPPRAQESGHCIATVAPTGLLAFPTVRMIGTAYLEGKSNETTRFTRSTPATNPNAAPAYSTLASRLPVGKDTCGLTQCMPPVRGR